ncbi:MAG: DUF3078 domain-containing protein [Chitinophagales bacterium]|nr:DUF3078 domain-containing protein [Chitinophagales bacterium]
MKQTLLAVVLLIAMQTVEAQDIAVLRLRKETDRSIKKDADTTTWRWKKGGVFSSSLAQGSLSNWAAGGDNFSLAANLYLNYFTFFKHERHTWDNNLDVNLGFVQTTSLGGRKNDDRFDFLSKYGYKVDTTGKWYLTGLFNFRSQFFDGYTFSNNIPNFTSSLLAPAYVLFSVGFDYKRSTKFSLFLSPITSRWVIVANSRLNKLGLYGVPAGKSSVSELGAFASANYNNTIAKNIVYKARLDLFSNYQNNPQNIDIFMTNVLSFKINKLLSATYNLDLIYDDDVRLFGPQKKSPGLQVKSLLGIGFLIQIPPKVIR